jgi:hypothetical protein
MAGKEFGQTSPEPLLKGAAAAAEALLDQVVEREALAAVVMVVQEVKELPQEPLTLAEVAAALITQEVAMRAPASSSSAIPAPLQSLTPVVA